MSWPLGSSTPDRGRISALLQRSGRKLATVNDSLVVFLGVTAESFLKVDLAEVRVEGMVPPRLPLFRRTESEEGIDGDRDIMCLIFVAVAAML